MSRSGTFNLGLKTSEFGIGERIEVHDPDDHADPHDHLAQPLAELVDLLPERGFLFVFPRVHDGALGLPDLRVHARSHHQRFAQAVRDRGAREEHVHLLGKTRVHGCADIGVLKGRAEERLILL